MAIRSIKSVPVEECAGKFVCTPSMLAEQEFGWPARVEKATKAFVQVVRLARGEWDNEKGEWNVLPVVGGERESDGAHKQYARKGVRLLCDTAEEAIALYVRSSEARKAIEEFRKQQLASVVDAALGGTLNLAAHQA
ncbi:hypothetical protein KTD31_03350 [Burkholderia multivorans]|uniref:hypothetical protein n=1 Tax=Burkholderia multivorans TaxID=87883 RepID=UPI001C20FD2C|nr:hypothetical protein [Burkholderia multivorans]MBU9200389.1 hypothetical protein [Burkholderia multivorans]MDN8078486.1 hypothetical protein [Burkholderia multivorans]